MDEQKEKIHACALRLLARRDHGRVELARKLAARKFSARLVSDECNRLQGVGLLDERTFVENYIRSRANRGVGPKKIRVELIGKGVDGEMVATLLDQAGVDWNDLRSKVLEKSLGAKRDNLPQKEKARLLRFLQSRGFSLEGLDFNQN